MSGFCSHPFNRVHLGHDGEVYVCCEAWLNISLGNIFSSDFEDIWNSKNAKLIRESVFDGSFRFCNKNNCPRIVSGAYKKEKIPRAFIGAYEKKQSILDFGPEHISLNYDNSCNIKCKSCRNHLIIIDKDNAKKLMAFNDDLINSKLFKNIKEVLVSGAGEVFASSVYMDFLSKIDQKKFPDLKFIIRTNGLLLTPEYWEKIKNAHYAIDKISISIDAATRNTYETVRNGGSFDKLINNLKFVKELKKKNKFTLKADFVVQQQNFKEMILFIEFAKKFDFDIIIFSRILNNGTYTKEEYRQVAIHEYRHPQFGEFIDIINQPAFDDPRVWLSNLSHLKNNKAVTQENITCDDIFSLEE